jgi:hypothetical protein
LLFRLRFFINDFSSLFIMNVYALIALLSAVAAAAGGAGAAPTGVLAGGNMDTSVPTFSGSNFDSSNSSEKNTHDQATFTGSNFDGAKSLAAADDDAEEREQQPTFTGSDFDSVADSTTPATQGRKHILPIKDDGEFHILPVKEDEFHILPVKEDEFHILPVIESGNNGGETRFLPPKIPDVMHGKVYSNEDAGKRHTMPGRPVVLRKRDSGKRSSLPIRPVDLEGEDDKARTLPATGDGDGEFHILPYPYPNGAAPKASGGDDGEFHILPYPYPNDAASKTSGGDDGEFHILPYPYPNGAASKASGDDDGEFHILPYPYPNGAASQASADASNEDDGKVWIQPVLTDNFGIAGAACGHRDGFNRYMCADGLYCVRPVGALKGPGSCQSDAKLGQSCNGPSRVPCARGTYCSATLRGDGGSKWGVCKPIY